MLKCRFIIASYLIDSSVKAPLGTFNKGKALVGTVSESCLANTNVYRCHNWGTRTLMLLHMLRSPWPGEAAVLPGMGDTPPPPPPSGVSGPPRSTPSPSCGGSLYAPIQFSILGRFFCLQSLDFPLYKCLTKSQVIHNSSVGFQFFLVNLPAAGLFQYHF